MYMAVEVFFFCHYLCISMSSNFPIHLYQTPLFFSEKRRFLTVPLMWHASAWQYMLLRPNPKTSCGTGFMKFPFDATLLNQFMQAIVEAIHCQWYFCFNNQAEADLWGLAACTYTPSPA